MFVCPQCATHLKRVRGQAGVVYWTCGDCGGNHVSLPVLRQHHCGQALWTLWRDYKAEAGTRGRPCPTCALPMKELPLTLSEAEEPLVLDVCGTCQFVWFDPGERERLPDIAPEPEVPEDTPLDAVIEQARSASRERHEPQKKVLDTLTQRPDFSSEGLSTLQQLLTFLVPVEGHHPTIHKPVATYGLLALVGLTSILAFQDLEAAVLNFGFIPAEPMRLGGLTALTSFFIHGGWAHLLGNAYFLWLTGDNVEDFLGPKRYLWLLVMATLVGAIVHGMFDPRPDQPCVGASGGISGLMAFYALRFPKARLHMRFAYVILWSFPFWMWFLFWVAMQSYVAMAQAMGHGSVSAFAHLGGAAVGFACWALWRRGRLAL